ncbi:MAG: RpiB/LacA/LacB family sugar-phosphate isomerase [Candidatus Moranbacteria bacterium]|nr:RpiB/LacA/LacB family sugar-phosphate isomerase [Candidatus Moranbacteria bacterium]
MSKQLIIIGSDHRGYKLKQELIKWLNRNKYEVKDYGTDSEKSVDYPKIAARAVNAVLVQDKALGVLICSSGIGMSMAANRFAGIRAALVYNREVAKHTREHNLANVICLAADHFSLKEQKKMLSDWLITKPTKKERYLKRTIMMDELMPPSCPGCF